LSRAINVAVYAEPTESLAVIGKPAERWPAGTRTDVGDFNWGCFARSLTETA
jgi:hypothetical protein